jgi:hypothetical protein
MGEIWAVIKALPQMIALFREAFDFLKKLFGDDPTKFLKDASVVFSELKSAQTVEEKKSAAKKIQDLVSRL